MTRYLAVALLLVTPSCVGSGEPDASNPAGAAGATGAMLSGALLPWAPGNTWTYRVTDSDGVFNKTTTVGDALEPVGLGPNQATLAYRVTTRKKDDTDKTVSWQNAAGDSVLRYREQSYSKQGSELELEEYWEPYALHIDGGPGHTQSGARWAQNYAETQVSVMSGVSSTPETRQVTDTWQVLKTEADHSSVTVPAGTFETPIVIQKSNGTTVKTYWYVRGIGKVKETGAQVEELVSYHLAP